MKILEEANLQYFLDYNISSGYNVYNHHVISGINVEHVKLMDLTEWIYSKLFPKNNLQDPIVYKTFQGLPLINQKIIGTSMLIARYCIYRLLSHFKVYSSSAWTYRLVNDYYGTQIEVIMLLPQLGKSLDEHFYNLKNRNDQLKIEYVLTIEYGRLLPTVMKKKWYVAEVDSNSLEFSNPVHLNNCLQGYYKRICTKNVMPEFCGSEVNAVERERKKEREKEKVDIADINTVETELNTVEIDVNTVETDVKTVETDVNTVETDVNTVETDVKTVETDVKTVEKTNEEEAVKEIEKDSEDSSESMSEEFPELPQIPLENLETFEPELPLPNPNPNPNITRNHVHTEIQYEYVPCIPRYLVEYNLPVALVAQKDDRYKVIDGYHRIASRIASNPGSKLIVIICTD